MQKINAAEAPREESIPGWPPVLGPQTEYEAQIDQWKDGRMADAIAEEKTDIIMRSCLS